MNIEPETEKVRTKRPKCPHGTRKNKAGECVPHNKKTVTLQPVAEVEEGNVDFSLKSHKELRTKRPKCPHGTRKNKAGECVPHNKKTVPLQSTSNSATVVKELSKKTPTPTANHRIDILVYCHIYDKEKDSFAKKAGIPTQKPALLYLFNEEKNSYDIIELNKDNLDMLRERYNIHILFIDKMMKNKDVDEYQKKRVSDLGDQKFDYIFPIFCPKTIELEHFFGLLKQNGKYIFGKYEYGLDDYIKSTGELHPTKKFIKELIRTMDIKRERDILRRDAEEAAGEKDDKIKKLEFSEYRKTKELYVSKYADMDTHLGFYTIYTPHA